ncbi:SusD/RagB family nutrient-binding outer membrane lipoprotein [uncultured Phocaeicola sp.]|uniref:SusD/RagB family nutrient-binding outer membrane lipoprotein n=1 Tax=uncultured Phocaeicola sp. TaxID=990718 RepID=UPI0026332CD0|nr:SusD/RagB family nutrient-binding outer membrane lipoprotein [uncultured Phocaeicola sp.]
MKHIKSLFLSLGIVAALTACDMTDFGDINKDPNEPSEANTGMLFTHACTYIKYFSLNSNYYYPWTQMYPGYMSEKNNNQYGAFAGLTMGTNTYYLYPLKECYKIIQFNNDEAERNKAPILSLGDSNNQIAVSRTLMGFIYMHLTDALGPLPYTEAFQADDDNFTPVFDSQETIYAKLDADLREAYKQFDENGSLSSADILFDGDVRAWKKLNASTRMMLAIKLADVDPAQGRERFAQAYADGAIEDNAYNLNYRFEANTVGYLYYNGVNNNSNFVPNAYYVDLLKELKDNRLFATCSLIPFGKTQAEAGVTDEDLKNFDKYQGIPLGIEASDLNKYNKTCCFYHPSLTQVTSTFPIITAARMLLIEAEAAQRGWIQADPATLYVAGVKASFEQWGAEGADEYLAQEAVAYTGTDAEKINKIAIQRWISGFMADGFEAWSDWRRFDVPKLEVGPVCTTISHVPYRHQYDSEIYLGNRENYEVAVKADLNGNDTRDQRVWWNRK